MLEPDICNRCLRYKRPKYQGQSYCYCAFDNSVAKVMEMNKEAKGGTKHDTGKPPLTLVPRAALEATAKVFAFGMKKYSRDNYKKGFEYTRLMDAALRHIVAAVDGENTDPESGESHVAHALCCLSMLLECERLGTLVDNRFKKEKT